MPVGRSVFHGSSEVHAEFKLSAINYAWLKRPESQRAKRRKVLAEKIKTVHDENLKVHGSPRVYKALKAQGEAVCENTVASAMQEHGIRPKTNPKFIPCTTDSNHQQPLAENRLDRQFKAELPNQKWAADITYIPTEEGWLYLAGVLDLCSRKIVGWSMADHMKTELVSDALTMAIVRRGQHPGCFITAIVACSTPATLTNISCN